MKMLSVLKLCVFVSGDLTGERKCSYEALRTGKIALQGLPTGLNFKDPWCHGKKTLQTVLENKDTICFRRKRINCLLLMKR